MTDSAQHPASPAADALGRSTTSARLRLGVAGVAVAASVGEAARGFLFTAACNGIYVFRFEPTPATALRMLAQPKAVVLLVPATMLLAAAAFLLRRAGLPRGGVAAALAVLALVVPLARGAAASPPWVARTTDCEGVPRYRPGTFSVPDGGVEPGYDVLIEPNGLRGPNPPVDDPRPKVLLVGDSWTFGAGLQHHETVAAALQRARPDLAVINAGLEGDHLAGMLDRAVHWAATYRPDQIVALASHGDALQTVGSTDICAMPAACRSRVDIMRMETQPSDLSLQRFQRLARAVAAVESASRRPLLVSLVAARPGWAAELGFDDAGWDQTSPDCSRPEHLFGPSAHPNAQGAACYAAAILERLAPPAGEGTDGSP